MKNRSSGRVCHPGYRFLAAMVVLTTLAGCGRDAGEDGAGRKGGREHLVETAPALVDNLSVVRTRTGTLRARREVRVFTQEEGRITQFPFFEGDTVKEGDVLVRLDDTLIRAQLSRASSTRRQAEQDAERLKKLLERKVVSEDEYARALTAVDVARADEQVLRTRHGYMTIRSPLEGVVRERLSDVGNIAERHQHLLTVSDPSSLLTELPVSGLVMPYIAIGDSAKVIIDALGDRTHAGRITRIYPSLDPVTRRGTIEVELQPVPAGAAAGQLCRVELSTHAAPRMVIPFSALRRDAAGEYVYLLDDAGKAQRADVRSGLRLAEKIEIMQGLEEGSQVITKGFLGLVPGKQVKPVSRGTQ